MNLSVNKIENVSSIGIALQTNEKLTTLDLSHNQIVDVSRIGEALEKNKTLTTLLLKSNRIIEWAQRTGEDGGKYWVQNSTSIQKALKTNKTLTKLNLRSDRFGELMPLLSQEKKLLKSIEDSIKRNIERNKKFMSHYKLKF